MQCIGAIVDEKVTCLFAVYDRDDPKATLTSFKRFKEGKIALTVKEALFSNPEDEAIAKFVTVCDPYEREAEREAKRKARREAKREATEGR